MTSGFTQINVTQLILQPKSQIYKMQSWTLNDWIHIAYLLGLNSLGKKTQNIKGMPKWSVIVLANSILTSLAAGEKLKEQIWLHVTPNICPNLVCADSRLWLGMCFHRDHDSQKTIFSGERMFVETDVPTDSNSIEGGRQLQFKLFLFLNKESKMSVPIFWQNVRRCLLKYDSSQYSGFHSSAQQR